MITELENSVTNVKQQLQIEDKTVIRSDHKLILPEEADYSLYTHVIENLEEKYGSLRIKEETDSENVRRRMANGLCYLDLMDFNNNNIKELIAVCRNDYEHSYHLYIYSIERGQVSCVLDINGVSFTDYGGKSRYDSTPSASTVWIANDPEGNAAVISGRIDCYESKYNMYGYDGFNYRKLHYLYSAGNGADNYFVDNDERRSRWKYDKLMAEW